MSDVDSSDSDEEKKEPPAPVGGETDLSWGDRMVVGPLSPRHRKLAELAAQGLPNKLIAEQLGYSGNHVSILLTNTLMKDEVARIRERIYEDTVASRIKRMAEPALAEIEKCLNDKTNRYKEPLKVETAKWLIEKIDGKAVQKHELGENALGSIMDKLDALKLSGKSLSDLRTVTPTTEPLVLDVQKSPGPAPEPTESDHLAEWVSQFTSGPKD